MGVEECGVGVLFRFILEVSKYGIEDSVNREGVIEILLQLIHCIVSSEAQFET